MPCSSLQSADARRTDRADRRDAIGKQKVVQAFGHEDKTLSRVRRDQRASAASARCARRSFRRITNPCHALCQLARVCGRRRCGRAGRRQRRHLTVGGLSSFLSYANQYTKPFNEISGVVTELQNALACAGARLRADRRTRRRRPDPADAETLDNPDGEVAHRACAFLLCPGSAS